MLTKTIEELWKDAELTRAELKAAISRRDDLHKDASIADGDVVRIAAELRAAEEAIIAASGESS